MGNSKFHEGFAARTEIRSGRKGEILDRKWKSRRKPGEEGQEFGVSAGGGAGGNFRKGGGQKNQGKSGGI